MCVGVTLWYGCGGVVSVCRHIVLYTCLVFFEVILKVVTLQFSESYVYRTVHHLDS